jgi:hypothetical protein
LATTGNIPIQQHIATNSWMFRDLEGLFASTELVLRHQSADAGAEAVTKLWAMVKKVDHFMHRIASAMHAAGPSASASSDEAKEELNDLDGVFGIHSSRSSIELDSPLAPRGNIPAFEVCVTLPIDMISYDMYVMDTPSLHRWIRIVCSGTRR